RVAPRVGDPQKLADGRHDRLAVAAAETLGDVEDDVGPLLGEAFREVRGRLEAHDVVARLPERALEGVDRLGRGGFGPLVALRALHVEGEADLERAPRLDGLLRERAPADARADASRVHDGLERLLEAEAQAPRGREDARPRLEAGQRVDLDEVDAAVAAEAE